MAGGAVRSNAVGQTSTPLVPTAEVGKALTILLSPLGQEAGTWRQEVTRAMRALLEADGATLLLFQDGTRSVYVDQVPQATVEEYFTHFLPYDDGLARRDALNLGLWNRRMLWDRDALLRSTYYNEFALRHDLHDSLGISLDIEPGSSHVRLVMTYGSAPLPPERAAELLSRAAVLIPALRTGFMSHLGLADWLRQIPQLIDKIGQPLALFSMTGGEIYRNAMMRRTLAQDPSAASIEEAISDVAQATAARAQACEVVSHSALQEPDRSRRQVQTPFARYRLRGCIMSLDDAPMKSVLVSMDRVARDEPCADALRARFGITRRESQVALLLVQRLTNSEIASALGISTHTARHHTENVLVKVGVNSRRALRRLLNAED